MDKLAQDYYEALIDMFATDGWKHFIQDQEDALEAMKDGAYIQCPDNDSWQVRRGEINSLAKLVNFEELIRYNLSEIEKDESEEQAPFNEYDPLH